MIRLIVCIVAVLTIGCATPRSLSPPSPTTIARGQRTLFERMPAAVDSFKLTHRTEISEVPGDSLFRYSDGSRANVSVIVYNIPPDVKVDADSQKWTPHEGEKFRIVQQIRRERGLIAAFVVSLSDTVRFAVNGRSILEHMIAVPTRYPDGRVTVEFQYLYLIDDKFLKVRATIPNQNWQQSHVPSFARALARRVADG